MVPPPMPGQLAIQGFPPGLPSRNKAIVCKRYFDAQTAIEKGLAKPKPVRNGKKADPCSGGCQLGGLCPYRHITASHEERVPRSICKFFLQGACLRDSCPFFHGTEQQLHQLLAIGAPTYRPAEYSPIIDAEEEMTSNMSQATTPAAQTPVHQMSRTNSIPRMMMMQTPPAY